MNPSFNDLFFLIPGLICYSIFYLFTPGLRKKEIGTVFTISFLISTLEYLLFSSLLNQSSTSDSQRMLRIYFCILFLLPAIIGFVFSLLVKSKSVRDFLSLGHYCASAWDYVFSGYGAWCYVIVTLKEGNEKIYGIFDSKSSASSNVDERDIFLSRTFDSEWNEMKNKYTGVLISSDQIKYIQIIKTKEK